MLKQGNDIKTSREVEFYRGKKINLLHAGGTLNQMARHRRR